MFSHTRLPKCEPTFARSVKLVAGPISPHVWWLLQRKLSSSLMNMWANMTFLPGPILLVSDLPFLLRHQMNLPGWVNWTLSRGEAG